MGQVLVFNRGNLTDSPYRNDSNGLLLRALFVETNVHSPALSLYTLKRHDHELNGKIYPSLYLLYMATEDVTEFEFASKYMESFTHWERLCECTWFKDHVSQWRKELELKIRAKALRTIIQESKSSSKNAFVASRFLVEKGWKDKPEGRGAGRISKEEIKKEAHQLVLMDNDIKSDFDRLLKQANGGTDAI